MSRNNQSIKAMGKPTSTNRSWVASTRRPPSLRPEMVSGPGYSPEDRRNGAKPACYSNVYLDNMKIYSGRHEEPLFNINTISPDRIEAIEYYSGVSQIPNMYTGLDTTCGVLVIWTRRYSP